jgi:hypothetical protein
MKKRKMIHRNTNWKILARCKADVHGKTEKAIRRQDKIETERNIVENTKPVYTLVIHDGCANERVLREFASFSEAEINYLELEAEDICAELGYAVYSDYGTDKQEQQF